MAQASAIRRGGGYTDASTGLPLSAAVLQNAPIAYQGALLRDQNAADDEAIAENTRQFNANLSLNREAMDRQSEDSNRATVIGGVQTLASMPGFTDKIFGSSDTASTIGAADPSGVGPGTGFEDMGFLESAKSGISEMTNPSVASGLSVKGVGQAGLGVAAGELVGGSDIQKGLVSAAVPMALNVGSALLDGGSVVDAMASSVFPSIGAGIGSFFL